MSRFRQMDWWYWLATDCLLISHLAGWRWGITLVMALTAVQWAHYLFRQGRIMAFPVQVRLGYLLLLVLGTLPYLGFIHWIQLIGTTAVVTAGYCPLARLLALLPWNRSRPLTPALAWKIITAAPVAGSILELYAGQQTAPCAPDNT